MPPRPKKPESETLATRHVKGVSLTFEELQQRRVLTITIDKDDNVEFSYPGMSVYEAQSLTHYVCQRLLDQVAQVWAMVEEPE